MVKAASKNTFYSIPTGTWFALRDKFKLKVPTTLSATYVASALDINTNASNAALLTLKAFGIINSNNEPTDLAYDWRDDDKYAEVCEKILRAVYPQELLDLYHSKSSTLPEVKAWFARAGRFGDSAATKCGRTYLLLLNGELKDTSTTRASVSSKVKKTPSTNLIENNTTPEKTISDPVKVKQPSGDSFSHKLHLDIQIHISPESSPEQIDKIFESMSKHLRGL